MSGLDENTTDDQEMNPEGETVEDQEDDLFHLVLQGDRAAV
jgi:hypothetical protein